MGIMGRIRHLVAAPGGTSTIERPIDTELERRVPTEVAGRPLSVMTGTLDDLTEDAQWWFGEALGVLGLPPEALTITQAQATDDGPAIRACRYRGAGPRELQRGLDLDADADRRMSNGNELLTVAGLRLSRSVAGKRSFVVNDDGTLAPAPEETAPDPARVHHDLVRGDTWFQLFGRDDRAWLEAAALAVAGTDGREPGRVQVDLPDTWASTVLPGRSDPAFADRIDRAAELADADAELWTQVSDRFRPAPGDLPFIGGTRLVAVDLAPEAMGRGATWLEAWEYLEPYESLVEEVAAEAGRFNEAGGRGSAHIDADGSRARLIVRIPDDEGGPEGYAEVHFIRGAARSYRLLFGAPEDPGDGAQIFETVARSFRIVT
jgi:hypothetical protein